MTDVTEHFVHFFGVSVTVLVNAGWCYCLKSAHPFVFSTDSFLSWFEIAFKYGHFEISRVADVQQIVYLTPGSVYNVRWFAVATRFTLSLLPSIYQLWCSCHGFAQFTSFPTWFALVGFLLAPLDIIFCNKVSDRFLSAESNCGWACKNLWKFDVILYDGEVPAKKC